MVPEERSGRNAHVVAVGEASAVPAAEVRASALGSIVRVLVAVAAVGLFVVLGERC